MPVISVLMSVYNGERFIAESIDNILNQTFKDFELIIINDGSTDNTENIIKGFKDQRIKLYNLKENLGVGVALQFGLSKVQGKYFAKADADDLNHPDRLLKQKTFLDTHPDISLVKSLIEYFPHNKLIEKSHNYLYKKTVLEKEKNLVISSKDIKEKLYWSCCVPHVTIMAHSNIIKEVGYNNLRIWEDYDLLYQLNKMGCKMATIEAILVKVRISDTSTTAITDNKDFVQVMYGIKKEEINNLFNNKSDVYIWGSGSQGRNISAVLTEHNLDFVGFIDSNENKQGLKIGDKTVFPPCILKSKSQNKIIVASQPGKFEIVDFLKNKGYQHLKDFVVYF